ncbi:hypothetical protein Lal_00025834 [Lupinus albus]|uniref:Uncharacterized protein n=1 Tax=Lupinus albus TaxID=3870 RepID=A0A6A4Q3P7_LUPAL|nr:hypothetical protein Lalb_Chr08g0234921 [Lupinus albus]KAF1870589.1 hypothetical protein Lal_00025834 [Lupinus albus]
MACISKGSSSRCDNKAYVDDDGDWYGYASAGCTERECHNGVDDSGFSPVSSMEGDDDDDGGYDYAPAA